MTLVDTPLSNCYTVFGLSGHVQHAGGHEVALRGAGAVRRLLPVLPGLRRLLLAPLLHVGPVQPHGGAGLQALHRTAGQLRRRLPLRHGDAVYVVAAGRNEWGGVGGGVGVGGGGWGWEVRI